MMADIKLGQTVEWSDGWPAPDAKLLRGQYVGMSRLSRALVFRDGQVHELLFADLSPVISEIEFKNRVSRERQRQDEKWGEQNHDPQKWLAILMEEVGEVAKAALEQDTADYEAELVQVAAVASAMFESWYRNEKGNQAMLAALALDMEALLSL